MRGKKAPWQGALSLSYACAISCDTRLMAIRYFNLIELHEQASSDLVTFRRFGRWVWSWAVPGLGMFNESYYIFSVGNVKPIWAEQYPDCWKVSNDQDLWSFALSLHRRGVFITVFLLGAEWCRLPFLFPARSQLLPSGRPLRWHDCPGTHCGQDWPQMGLRDHRRHHVCW